MKPTTAWALSMVVLYLVAGAVAITVLVVGAPVEVLGGLAFVVFAVTWLTAVVVFS